MPGFDRVARYYDWLARSVFGDAIFDSQSCFLPKIQPTSRVLVIGGGTGWWLPDFLLTRPTVRMVYVEASINMLEIARRGTGPGDQVTFIHGTLDSIESDEKFDVVVTFYFLDVFGEGALDDEIQKIKHRLRPGSLWLVADFVNTQAWHSLLLFMMYKFFRLTTGLDNQKLPLWRAALLRRCLKELDKKYFYKGFIQSAVFEAV